MNGLVRRNHAAIRIVTRGGNPRIDLGFQFIDEVLDEFKQFAACCALVGSSP